MTTKPADITSWAITWLENWYLVLPKNEQDKPIWFIPDGYHTSGVTIKQMINEIQAKTEVGLTFAYSLHDTVHDTVKSHNEREK